MAKEITDKERIEKGEVLVRAMLEVAGSPKEHIEKVIVKLVDKLEEQPYVSSLISEEIFEAAEHEEHKSVFTSVAEVEVWFKEKASLADFVFDFMPASVEVIEPEISEVKNNIFSNFCNEFSAKLHKTEMFVKNLNVQQQVLERRLNVLLRNFIMSQLFLSRRKLPELSKIIGIPEETLKSFMELLKNDGEIIEQDGVYIYNKERKIVEKVSANKSPKEKEPSEEKDSSPEDESSEK